MSIERITIAAKRAWLESGSELSYKMYIQAAKASGFFWSAADE